MQTHAEQLLAQGHTALGSLVADGLMVSYFVHADLSRVIALANFADGGRLHVREFPADKSKIFSLATACLEAESKSTADAVARATAKLAALGISARCALEPTPRT